MKRWVFNITAVLSLLLLLAMVGLWVDGCSYETHFGFAGNSIQWNFLSGNGEIALHVCHIRNYARLQGGDGQVIVDADENTRRLALLVPILLILIR